MTVKTVNSPVKLVVDPKTAVPLVPETPLQEMPELVPVKPDGSPKVLNVLNVNYPVLPVPARKNVSYMIVKMLNPEPMYTLPLTVDNGATLPVLVWTPPPNKKIIVHSINLNVKDVNTLAKPVILPLIVLLADSPH